MLKLVETVNNSSYLCTELAEVGAKTTLTGAIGLGDVDVNDDEIVAKLYLQRKLQGTLRTITLNTANIVTIMDDGAVADLVDTYEKRLPIARRRAEAKWLMDVLFEGEA